MSDRDDDAQNVPGVRGRPFTPGHDPRRGTTGGRRPTLVAVQEMLDKEHRDVDKMRETFALIRKVAHGVDEPVFYKGDICGHVTKYDGAWMALYLDRVLGAVERGKIDLSDAPPEVLEYLSHKLV